MKWAHFHVVILPQYRTNFVLVCTVLLGVKYWFQLLVFAVLDVSHIKENKSTVTLTLIYIKMSKVWGL